MIRIKGGRCSNCKAVGCRVCEPLGWERRKGKVTQVGRLVDQREGRASVCGVREKRGVPMGLCRVC